MKNFAVKIVWFTTLYVFIFAGLCQTTIIALPVLISLLIIGHFLILFMVYIVLNDNYSTTKTFNDWYEDHPKRALEEG